MTKNKEKDNEVLDKEDEVEYIMEGNEDDEVIEEYYEEDI